MQFTIDCTGFTTARMLHDAFAEVFEFPDYYGYNLDALHDCLTAMGEDTQITLLHFPEDCAWAKVFRWVLRDCQEENPHLTVHFK